MGQVLSHVQWLWDSFRRETAVLVLGLDNAGKTATLYALHLGEPMPYTIPTLGLNVEAVKVGNLDIKMWDIGGQDKYRALWHHYFAQADGIAFVVDASDRERFEQVREELHTLMSHKELVGKPFLILANKQDLPMAVTKKELTSMLQLDMVKSSECVGWIAARALPPKPPDDPVLQLPSSADVQILAEYVLNALAMVKKKLNEKD